MEYGDILIYLENLIEEIESEDLDLLEIKSKLSALALEVEDNTGFGERDLEGFSFSDLD